MPYLAHFPVEDVLQVGNVLKDGHITANTTIRRQNNKHMGKGRYRKSLSENTR